jgi:hypothetical protein
LRTGTTSSPTSGPALPRRITPIHLYFHYYVVEQPGGERALRDIYDWIRRRRSIR